jgi:hypothetical protein
MSRKPDLGAFFESLTKRGRGGRRTEARSAPQPAPPSRSGGVTATVRDALERRRRSRRRDDCDDRTDRTDRPDRDDRRVRIEYTPSIDGDPDPGEIVWAWVPYEEDPTQGKDRPVVVIGHRGRTLVGIPLTTKHDDRELQVEIGTGTWDADRRVSYARIWRMVDVDPQRMRREGSVLARDRFDRVAAAVASHYDVDVVTDRG